MTEQDHKLIVRTEREPKATILHLTGEIDLRTSPQLRGEFLVLIDQKPPRIILDLSEVAYIDSSGVGTIVELKRKTAKHKSNVILVGLQPRVRSLFEITRLDAFFDIVETLDEAREK